ncbi:hypothetical protein [Neptuniibacter sp. QD37_11]|uniref:hypothetical protein n=1 Tax=Neptuniibacter sp. QD37_11 TaxID=3398209 RepID=UPI0039F57AA6
MTSHSVHEPKVSLSTALYITSLVAWVLALIRVEISLCLDEGVLIWDVPLVIGLIAAIARTSSFVEYKAEALDIMEFKFLGTVVFYIVFGATVLIASP